TSDHYSAPDSGVCVSIQFRSCLSALFPYTTLFRSSTTVRTVETGVSHDGAPGCGYWNYQAATWDGTNDSGTLVANGVYTVHIHATDTAHATDAATLQLRVQRRAREALTQPTPGSTL